MNSVLTMQTRRSVCHKHGEYESRSLSGLYWSGCSTCSAERTAANNAEQERVAAQKKQDALHRLIRGAEIPHRFIDRSLKSFVAETNAQHRALEFATTYAANFNDVMTTGRSAMFVGKPGTGKTHLACAIGLHIMHRDSRSVLFTTAMRATRRVKDTWGKTRDETETQAISAMVSPDLLVLDEVGVQFGSDTEKLILFDVLNERYEWRQPTLLLSNLDLVGVRNYIGERVFDRMREDGGEVVVFDWDSYRGRAAK